MADRWNAEQREWIRANWPGRRERVPSVTEAVKVFGQPLPDVANWCCNVITREEASMMLLKIRREELRSTAETERRRREDAWAGFYEGE